MGKGESENAEPLLRGTSAEEHMVARVIIEDVNGVPETRVVLGSQKGATSFSSVFTLCNSCIGAGVLSLPYAFRRAGRVLIPASDVRSDPQT